MKKVWDWIKNNPNRSMFLLPILLVAAISISHVVSWYDMANPINWAIYLSIAIEVAAITALVAATNQIKGGIWFMFGIVTFIQMIGNIFYSFKEIDETGELFKSWIELTGPVWELMGTETTDLVGMKRWLAFLEGGLLPIISLTSLHFFVKYEKSEEEKEPSGISERLSDLSDDKPTVLRQPLSGVEVVLTDEVEISEMMDNRVDGYIVDESIPKEKATTEHSSVVRKEGLSDNEVPKTTPTMLSLEDELIKNRKNKLGE
jgi:hypothetical protein